jgi:hypothetical protein
LASPTTTIGFASVQGARRCHRKPIAPEYAQHSFCELGIGRFMGICSTKAADDLRLSDGANGPIAKERGQDLLMA